MEPNDVHKDGDRCNSVDGPVRLSGDPRILKAEDTDVAAAVAGAAGITVRDNFGVIEWF